MCPELFDLSIIIVNWNTQALLADCLAAVDLTVRSSDQLSAEVLVVDNASIDDSISIVKSQFPWVRLIENAENAGFARANNQAMRIASGRYILLLNSDTTMHLSLIHI